MSQPPIAKAADVFGRVNTYIACVIFYVIGYIIVAASTSICKCLTWLASGANFQTCMLLETLSTSSVRHHQLTVLRRILTKLGITGLFLLQNVSFKSIDTSLTSRSSSREHYN